MAVTLNLKLDIEEWAPKKYWYLFFLGPRTKSPILRNNLLIKHLNSPTISYS